MRYDIIQDGQRVEIVEAVTIDGFLYPIVSVQCLSDEERTALSILPHVLSLDELKAQLRAEVDATRDQRIAGGFDFNGYRIQSRASDRENIANLGLDARDAVAAGAEVGDYFWHPQFPQGFAFITADNEIVPLDAHQMVALRDRGIEFKAGQTFYGRGLKDQVDAAADQAALDAIDLTTGWPD